MFELIIDKEEVLEKLMNYSPGDNNISGDIKLRQGAEHVIPIYDDLDEDIQNQFPREKIMSQYDFLKQNVPLDESFL
ncbi:MAG: hypothetical protein ABIJ14_03570 [Nanoarchaeota archaeon]|nr:hypothetical protein [Nanoarchaeota archaeon]